LLVLATVAGCIGNSRALLLKKGWVEPCALWCLTVADSGKQKSPPYLHATDPLLSVPFDLLDAHREEVEDFDRRLEVWQDTPRAQGGDKPRRPPARAPPKALVAHWFRRMSLALHPDRSGTTEGMAALIRANDELLRLLDEMP